MHTDHLLTEPYTIHDEVPTELLEPARPKKPTRDQRLLAEVEAVFRRFMAFPHEHAYTVATLWVAHTHLRGGEAGEVFLPRITPRLYFGSKTAGCGKTTAMELATLMAANGHIAVEPTQPSLVSSINNHQRTIGLDEIDEYFGPRGNRQSGVRGILNTGYKRGATIDCVRSDEVEERNVHAPLCLAGKNAHKFLTADNFETLRTRSHSIIMEKISAGHQLEVYDSERHEKRLRAISTNLSKWGLGNGRVITGLDVSEAIPDKIVARDREIWVVLFQIAAFVGVEWLERVTDAARALTLGEWRENDTPQLSPAEELLHACREAFSAGETFLPTRELLRRVMARDGWWHLEWSNPRAASMGLADELATFGIDKRREYVDGRQERGYLLLDLLDVDDDEPEEPEPSAKPVDEWDWDSLEDD